MELQHLGMEPLEPAEIADPQPQFDMLDSIVAGRNEFDGIAVGIV